MMEGLGKNNKKKRKGKRGEVRTGDQTTGRASEATV